MGNFCGPQLIPPTQNSVRYILVIKIIMFLQIVIAILNLIAIKVFLRQGIFGLFFLILLHITYYRLSYNCILVYIFISIFFMIKFLVFALTMAQNWEYIDLTGDGWLRFYLAVACISCLFYLFNSIFFYYPYKEFKVIQFFQNPAFEEIMATSAVAQSNQELNQINNNNANKKNHKKNPKNRNQDINVNNQQINNIPINSDIQKSTNKQTTYQVFKGQGIRIG